MRQEMKHPGLAGPGAGDIDSSSEQNYNARPAAAPTFKLAWLDQVASKDGPKSPTTRLVLLVLAKHMDTNGGSCFPSVRTLADETGINKNCVSKHLRIAADDGWLSSFERTRAGHGWKRHAYTARIPDRLAAISSDRRHAAEVPAPDTSSPAERVHPGCTPSPERVHSGEQTCPPSVTNVSTQGVLSPPLGPQEKIHREGACAPPDDSSSSRKATRRKPLVEIPEELDLTESMAAYCREKAPHVDPQHQFEKFKNHHQSKGNKFRDWQSAWRTWVLNATKWEKPEIMPRRTKSIYEVMGEEPDWMREAI